VDIKILDKNGYPALGVYYVTLKSSDGSWVEKDIQDSEPGKQIRVEGGRRTVYYRTSGVKGEVQVRVSTSEFNADAAFLPVRILAIYSLRGASIHVWLCLLQVP